MTLLYFTIKNQKKKIIALNITSVVNTFRVDYSYILLNENCLFLFTNEINYVVIKNNSSAKKITFNMIRKFLLICCRFLILHSLFFDREAINVIALHSMTNLHHHTKYIYCMQQFSGWKLFSHLFPHIKLRKVRDFYGEKRE